jgi:hypothetical protein
VQLFQLFSSDLWRNEPILCWLLFVFIAVLIFPLRVIGVVFLIRSIFVSLIIAGANATTTTIITTHVYHLLSYKIAQSLHSSMKINSIFHLWQGKPFS